jgi:hypothetical protein
VNRALFAGLAFCFVSCTASADRDDPTEKLKKNLPRPVAALIDRIVDCNHWLGESPYDEGRGKEIKQAISELRCLDLKNDEKAVLKKYRSNPKVKKAIDVAKDTVL